MEIHENNNFCSTKKKISEETAKRMGETLCKLYILGRIDLEYVKN